MRRLTTAVVVLAGALVLAACEGTSDGTATPVSTVDKSAATAALWDPCTQIGDDVLRQVGVDPSTRDTTIAGVQRVAGWKLCSWNDKPSGWNYNLGVWSTIHSLDEVRGDKNNINFTESQVAGRTGVQFRKADDRDNLVCYLAFPTKGQIIEVSIYKSFTTKTPADNREPCSLASRAATILAPTFPAE
ncbi:DUF3558 domain-containing protein [Nocardia sp. NEAU-351]|uniref:DUF3558 domain-containing protein n=1 Tax=Nocardia bovistercoris TaxID=2785916 RepID=A0A931IEE3_9NOCA|nr:DUF3558 domain-containing protein [Nocardia bovistercoris]